MESQWLSQTKRWRLNANTASLGNGMHPMMLLTTGRLARSDSTPAVVLTSNVLRTFSPRSAGVPRMRPSDETVIPNGCPGDVFSVETISFVAVEMETTLRKAVSAFHPLGSRPQTNHRVAALVSR